MKIDEYRQLKTKKPKYGNEKTIVDGIVFDSKKEAARYRELKLMFAAGLITDLSCQPQLSINVHDVHICDYVADFAYADLSDGCKEIWEDVKSPITRRNPVYRLKIKLVKAIYGIEIKEV